MRSTRWLFLDRRAQELRRSVTKIVVEGASVLLPLGSPLPDDSVSALRGESGMLGRLSVPLSWGVAVPDDDYDHWAPEPGDDAEAIDQPVPGLITPETADDMGEWNEQNESTGWEGEAEPRFDIPRTTRVVPHSPAAG